MDIWELEKVVNGASIYDALDEGCVEAILQTLTTS